ncbi:unnamed protein product [Callosobruchus maculatus]|nr:unnamed protein product [Callosobruchus maculatus]
MYDDESDDDDINYADHPFINTIWDHKPFSDIIVEMAIIFPVVVLGIFGNILIIHVLVHNPPMRTPTNLLIGNMAAADLLSLLIHPWVILTYDFFQNYQLGPIVCRGEAAVE